MELSARVAGSAKRPDGGGHTPGPARLARSHTPTRAVSHPDSRGLTPRLARSHTPTRGVLERDSRGAQGSSFFCTFPIALRGSDSTYRISRGRLCGAIRLATWSM